MVTAGERTPQERETLIFPSAEEAQGWLEQFGEHLGQEQRLGIRRRRELLGEELAEEFEKQGEGVALIARPWEHTQAEHAEVQHLVDVAFARDLPAALKLARSSGYYPRNIDLFHDVLTTEMYQLLREEKLNQQPLAWGVLGMVGIIIVVGGIVVLMLVL